MSPQGKRPKAAAAAEAARKRHENQRRIALVAFAALLIGAFVWVAAAQGLGDPSVPEGDIAVVEDAPDGTITKEDFDETALRAALGSGQNEVPAEDDPNYEDFKATVVDNLILSRWVAGEAEEQGIEIEERAIDEELDRVLEEQFGGDQKELDKFLKESGFTEEAAREQLRLGLYEEKLQENAVPENAVEDVTDDEVSDYYEQNIEEFKRDETRDVRVILTRDEGEAQEALDELGSDPSTKDWERIAKEYSTDDSTRNSGGLRPGVIEGQSDPALDDVIFAAEEGEIGGPVEAESGFYVYEVEKITSASTVPLEEAEEQIRQTIGSTEQQAALQSFIAEFEDKWVSRTHCAEDYIVERCANAPAPDDPCTEDVADTTGCDAPVAARPVFEPGTAPVLGTQADPTLQVLRPQSPCAWLDPEDESMLGRSCEAWPLKPAPEGGALPPGLTLPPGTAPPGGAVPPGAVPPGAVPPGAAPQGAVPPGAAPQGAVPPGAVPPGG